MSLNCFQESMGNDSSLLFSRHLDHQRKKLNRLQSTFIFVVAVLSFLWITHAFCQAFGAEIRADSQEKQDNIISHSFQEVCILVVFFIKSLLRGTIVCLERKLCSQDLNEI